MFMNELTPMMRQYMEVKQQYPDCFLFYRLGDFYEMFFDDAIEGSKILELTLTGRDCGLEERAPMCGVPYHAVDTYVNKMISQGHKVAICEQMEDPALAKGLVQRSVIRVITPGTVIEEKMLDGSKNNYIFAIDFCENAIGYAYADVSTGAFTAAETYGTNAQTLVLDELTRLSPSEIIANEKLFEQDYLTKKIRSGYYLEKLANVRFHPEQAEKRLLEHFGVASLKGFGLELTQPLQFNGNKKSTLLYLLDATKTSMGARLLRTWIDCPLQSKNDIIYRLQAVDTFYHDLRTRKSIREYLDSVYEIERLTSKIAYGTINGRDCIALMNSLRQITPITMLLCGIPAEAIDSIVRDLDPMDDVIGLIDAAIDPNPPINIRRQPVHARSDRRARA